MKQELCLWLWLCLLGSGVALREHFCERNVSVSSMVPVNKQHTIVKQPSKWKFWKKSQEITETYATHEEQISYKVISECCPGYLQVATGLCEPICERGCPAFASCVAPQRCQCTAGYVSAISQRDNSHYCEPVCDSFCSDGSECVGPNTCACKEGYNAAQPVGDAVSAPCLPSCRLNNGCENGKCDEAADVCVCNESYAWSTILHACIQTHFRPITEEQSVEEQEMTTIREQGIEEPSKPIVCEKGFVLYAGQCRAEFFESNELQVKHCRLTGCGAHQTCDEATGNCTCNIGYSKDEPKEGVTTLTCHRSILGDILSIDQAVDDEDEINFFTIPVLGFASGFLFVLVVASLITRIRRGRHGGIGELGISAEGSAAL
ncbi:cell death abnormality protein 1 [Drosophila sulfurigaster albostrigata]|uniref:cell death abnormality protein 1 n=1 Tax=Drosophila sulfurigaster albostrigata TaxID=89887 RepID=UPI002D21D6A8|nr:cell death abnormality protein 1 [Drosophila sulfurigaster albostrigata]